MHCNERDKENNREIQVKGDRESPTDAKLEGHSVRQVVTATTPSPRSLPQSPVK